MKFVLLPRTAISQIYFNNQGVNKSTIESKHTYILELAKLIGRGRIGENRDETNVHEHILKYIGPYHRFQTAQCRVKNAHNGGDCNRNVQVEPGHLLEGKGRRIDDDATVHDRVEYVDNCQEATGPYIETHLQILVRAGDAEIVKQGQQCKWD